MAITRRTVVMALMVLSMAMLSTPVFAAAPSHPIPSAIDPAGKYLFFHHNYYVETKGPDGDCRYEEILKSFSDRGYTVISEIRPKDASVVEYGKKAAGDVSKLLSAGVPAENIAVAGHSKGGAIVLQAAAQLDNPKMNYLVLAGCGIKGLEKGYPDFTRLKGNFLSLYASSDKVAGSCSAPFSLADPALTRTSEKVLESGSGHQLFFKPQALWLEPAFAWLSKGR